MDIQAKLKQGKGIGYERWAKKHNLKAMAQTLILLQEKGYWTRDALDQRIAELDTKFHESLAVVKDLETRMQRNKNLRNHVAAYQQYRPIAQKLNAAKSPAAFEEQHRAELTAYRAAAAILRQTTSPSYPARKSWKLSMRSWHPKRQSSTSSTRKQGRTAQTENRKAECCVYFREEEPAQQER